MTSGELRPTSAWPRVSPGRLLYLAWYAPRAAMARRNKEGWINTALSANGHRQMRKAASRLSPLPQPSGSSPSVFFLTGARFWHQTLFCAYSLQRATGECFRFNLIDDGSLTKSHGDILRRTLTECIIHDAASVKARLDQVLPEARFPTLRRRRLEYPHIRKLTDIHAMGPGWKLVLDSDMLFHSRPAAIMNWLAQPSLPIHMRDVETAYGYSQSLLEELAGGTLRPLVNVGVCGLRSEGIDWDQLEHWCRVLTEREGTHYLQEQALTAMLMIDGSIEISPGEGLVCPSRIETTGPTGSLHHYVASSKAWYFRFAWRGIADRGGRSESDN